MDCTNLVSLKSEYDGRLSEFAVCRITPEPDTSQQF